MTNEEKFNLKIGKNIKKYRLLYNVNKEYMGQKELAQKVGVSTSTISTLESDRVPQGISVYKLYKISKVLGVSVEKLIE